MRSFHLHCAWFLILGLCFGSTAWSAEEKLPGRSAQTLASAAAITDGDVSVNVAANGRFNLGVADPLGNWDLVYRWPGSPGTSFTTVRINGQDFVYGTGGTVVEAPGNLDERTNRSRWRFGDVEVEQTLAIVDNPFSTTVKTVRIEYAVTNTGSVPEEVGLRLLVDTELNDNDGAPFRIPGEELVTRELDLAGAGVPSTFQVFFTASDARRVGTAILSGFGATRPDRLVIAAWPRIFPTAFDFTPSPTQSILADSAYAAYWSPGTLEAGATRRYVTYYGPASLTADARPPIAATLSSPVRLDVSATDYTPNPFDVVVTLRNIGGSVALGVVAGLTLPVGLVLVSGTGEIPVGVLVPGQERQVTWRVRAEPQPADITVELVVQVSADNADPKELRRPLFIPSLLASCEQLFDIGSRRVRSRPCGDILRAANLLSAQANPPSGPGRTHFSRAEIELFFDAAECRTGVPAPLLRSLSFEEALGVYYADPHPRQFLEPCEQVRNRNGNIGSIELWQRYYGVACPVQKSRGACVEVPSQSWPLLAVGDVQPGCDPTVDTCPADPPAPGLGIDFCALFPQGDCRSSSFACPGAAGDPNPADNFDAPGIGGTPPLPAPAGGDWQAVAPALIPVALGDDRAVDANNDGKPDNIFQTFGLGLMQVTIPIDDIAPYDRVTVVRDESRYGGDGRPGVPLGGGVPFSGGYGIEPLDERAVIAVVRDPQFNVVVGAQLAVIKWQQITGSAAQVTECRDADYGRLITLHTAPPFVGGTAETRGLWTCSVGSIKAGSASCAGRGPTLVAGTMTYDFARNLPGAKKCFGQFYNDRLAAGCRAAQRFAFTFACDDLRSYYGGDFPAGDPCRALIQEFQTEP